MRLLAAGGMSDVFLARHRTLPRSAAIKILRPKRSTSGSRRRERFLRERKLTARILDRHFPTVYGAGTTPSGLPYIVLERIKGRSLDAIQRQGRALPNAEAIRITLEIARALAHLHERQIVHRDVKPANVMLTKAGEVRLIDLGLARRTHTRGRREERLTTSGFAVGTPTHMAPEVSSGEEALVPADLYGLGLILHALLTGTRRTIGRLPPCRLPDALPDTQRVLAKLLAWDPADRYADAREVIQDLKRVKAGLGPDVQGSLDDLWRATSPQPREAKTNSPALLPAWVIGAVALIVVLSGVAFGYALVLQTRLKRLEAGCECRVGETATAWSAPGRVSASRRPH